MQIDRNTGLVLEGGGMRGVFTSGVLDAFMKYKLYLFNVVHIGCNIIRPNVEIRLVDSGGNVITSQSSGEIAPNNRNREEWHEFSGQLNPGTNTEFSIQIRSIAVGYSGNDLAIDDIYVYQEPKACPSCIKAACCAP